MNPYGIQLRQPLAGDLVGARLTIAAIGTAFEASYGWRLVAGGNRVAEGFFTAGSTGTLEAFVHDTAVETTHTGRATLEVFGDDPSGHSDGADLVEVAVIVLPGRRGYVPHQVVGGDTLSKLARRYDSSVEHIALANGLADPNRIRIGQLLRVPV